MAKAKKKTKKAAPELVINLVLDGEVRVEERRGKKLVGSSILEARTVLLILERAIKEALAKEVDPAAT